MVGLSEAPLRRWHGVAVDAQGRVVGLNLRYNGLSGAIPPELGSLSNLWSLSLGWNELDGPIPPELGGLSSLRGLNLSGNALSGAIPAELGNLSNLGSLFLEWNALSGAIPPELGSLSNLVGLSLYRNELSGAIPPELGSLSNLVGLFPLPERTFGRDPPGSWATCRTWIGCTSSGTTFPARSPRSWETCRICGFWNLDWNDLSGPIPPVLGDLSNLVAAKPRREHPLRLDPTHVRRTGEPDRAGAVAQRGVGRSHAGGPEEPGAGVAPWRAARSFAYRGSRRSRSGS